MAIHLSRDSNQKATVRPASTLEAGRNRQQATGNEGRQQGIGNRE
ncbi:MAG: hypothetical protein AB4426_01140 [Xenococcaceae cyanobacterium]